MSKTGKCYDCLGSITCSEVLKDRKGKCKKFVKLGSELLIFKQSLVCPVCGTRTGINSHFLEEVKTLLEQSILKTKCEVCNESFLFQYKEITVYRTRKIDGD
jgi:hypothetical protein